MAARHVEIAREDGPKAGFKAWKEQMGRSGLPQVKARLREVEAQGNTKAQFDYYCAQYGKQIFGNKAAQATAATAPAPASTEALTELFAQFLASQGIGSVEVESEDDDLDSIDEDAAIENYTRSSGGTTRSRKAATGDATPAQDAFAPRDPNAAATAGRLWKLNEAGLLQIRKTAGTVIDNGQAHEVLRKILG